MEFVLRAYAPVASGYSSYKLGVTLVEDYKITDGTYVLANVNVLEDQIYDMLTVNGSVFRVRDNVRGKSVHLVRVTDDGEKEIKRQLRTFWRKIFMCIRRQNRFGRLFYQEMLDRKEGSVYNDTSEWPRTSCHSFCVLQATEKNRFWPCGAGRGYVRKGKRL